jgi:hypothetical protein
MVLRMTREEYTKTYGVEPIIPTATKAEPRKMTKAEYDAEFGQPPKVNYFQRVGAQYQKAGQDIVGAIKQGAEAQQLEVE